MQRSCAPVKMAALAEKTRTSHSQAFAAIFLRSYVFVLYMVEARGALAAQRSLRFWASWPASAVACWSWPATRTRAALPGLTQHAREPENWWWWCERIFFHTTARCIRSYGFDVVFEEKMLRGLSCSDWSHWPNLSVRNHASNVRMQTYRNTSRSCSCNWVVLSRRTLWINMYMPNTWINVCKQIHKSGIKNINTSKQNTCSCLPAYRAPLVLRFVNFSQVSPAVTAPFPVLVYARAQGLSPRCRARRWSHVPDQDYSSSH